MSSKDYSTRKSKKHAKHHRDERRKHRHRPHSSDDESESSSDGHPRAARERRSKRHYSKDNDYTSSSSRKRQGSPIYQSKSKRSKHDRDRTESPTHRRDSSRHKRKKPDDDGHSSANSLSDDCISLVSSTYEDNTKRRKTSDCKKAKESSDNAWKHYTEVSDPYAHLADIVDKHKFEIPPHIAQNQEAMQEKKNMKNNERDKREDKEYIKKRHESRHARKDSSKDRNRERHNKDGKHFHSSKGRKSEDEYCATQEVKKQSSGTRDFLGDKSTHLIKDQQSHNYGYDFQESNDSNKNRDNQDEKSSRIMKSQQPQNNKGQDGSDKVNYTKENMEGNLHLKINNIIEDRGERNQKSVDQQGPSKTFLSTFKLCNSDTTSDPKITTTSFSHLLQKLETQKQHVTTDSAAQKNDILVSNSKPSTVVSKTRDPRQLNKSYSFEMQSGPSQTQSAPAKDPRQQKCENVTQNVPLCDQVSKENVSNLQNVGNVASNDMSSNQTIKTGDNTLNPPPPTTGDSRIQNFGNTTQNLKQQTFRNAAPNHPPTRYAAPNQPTTRYAAPNHPPPSQPTTTDYQRQQHFRNVPANQTPSITNVNPRQQYFGNMPPNYPPPGVGDHRQSYFGNNPPNFRPPHFGYMAPNYPPPCQPVDPRQQNFGYMPPNYPPQYPPIRPVDPRQQNFGYMSANQPPPYQAIGHMPQNYAPNNRANMPMDRRQQNIGYTAPNHPPPRHGEQNFRNVPPHSVQQNNGPVARNHHLSRKFETSQQNCGSMTSNHPPFNQADKTVSRNFTPNHPPPVIIASRQSNCENGNANCRPSSQGNTNTEKHENIENMIHNGTNYGNTSHQVHTTKSIQQQNNGNLNPNREHSDNLAAKHSSPGQDVAKTEVSPYELTSSPNLANSRANLQRQNRWDTPRKSNNFEEMPVRKENKFVEGVMENSDKELHSLGEDSGREFRVIGKAASSEEKVDDGLKKAADYQQNFNPQTLTNRPGAYNALGSHRNYASNCQSSQGSTMYASRYQNSQAANRASLNQTINPRHPPPHGTESSNFQFKSSLEQNKESGREATGHISQDNIKNVQQQVHENPNAPEVAVANSSPNSENYHKVPNEFVNYSQSGAEPPYTQVSYANVPPPNQDNGTNIQFGMKKRNAFERNTRFGNERPMFFTKPPSNNMNVSENFACDMPLSSKTFFEINPAPPVQDLTKPPPPIQQNVNMNTNAIAPAFGRNSAFARAPNNGANRGASAGNNRFGNNRAAISNSRNNFARKPPVRGLRQPPTHGIGSGHFKRPTMRVMADRRYGRQPNKYMQILKKAKSRFAKKTAKPLDKATKKLLKKQRRQQKREEKKKNKPIKEHVDVNKARFGNFEPLKVGLKKPAKGHLKPTPELYWPQWWSLYGYIEKHITPVDANDDSVRPFLQFLPTPSDKDFRKRKRTLLVSGVTKLLRHTGVNETDYALRDAFGLMKCKHQMEDPKFQQHLNAKEMQRVEMALKNARKKTRRAFYYQSLMCRWHFSTLILQQADNGAPLKCGHARKLLQDKTFNYLVGEAIQELKKLILEDWPGFAEFYEDFQRKL